MALERLVDLPGGDIPYPHSVVIGFRHQPAAIGRERDATERVWLVS